MQEINVLNYVEASPPFSCKQMEKATDVSMWLSLNLEQMKQSQ